MKISKNLARILLLFLLFIIITTPLINAAESINPSKYNPNNKNGTVSTDTNTILNIGGKLWGILSTVGAIVSVIALAIIGLRSVFGSIDDKAAYKKAMMPYIIGLCMVVGISVIVNLVYDFANEVDKTDYYAAKQCSNCGKTLSSSTERFEGLCTSCIKKQQRRRNIV